MPLFTQPLMLFGLAALPVLVGIYLLRNRYRPQPVSSLLLWLDPSEARTGGPRIDRLQTPLLFFLELLLLALLSLAAAGPHLPLSEGGRPLVVILDDSFSMLAGEPDSPRAAALKDLDEELKRGGRTPIRFVLAGEKPVLLGDKVTTLAEARAVLEGWRCRAGGASLQEAIAFGAEMGGELAALLVITDGKPPPELPLDKGRIQWRAFGKKRDNGAFVNAVRTRREGVERCLLEIANLAKAERSTTLTMETEDAAPERKQLTLGPGEVQRLVLQLKEDAGAFTVRLGDDDLPLDNHVTLLPSPDRKVRVQLSLADATVRAQVEKALKATKSVIFTSERPALLLTDAPNTPELTDDTWVFHLTTGKQEVAYDGPFVMDRAHPLTEGLSLQGVIWAPGTKGAFPGNPVILAGGEALLTDSEDTAGRRLLRLRLRHELSNLLESPTWPVLLSNLVQWRASVQPGLNRSNIRLGEEVMLTLANASEEVRLLDPDKKEQILQVQDGRVVARGEQMGIYEIRLKDDVHRFSVNALQREESDLRECVTGTWGDWLDETALRMEYRDVTWLLLLIALAVAAAHLLLTARLKGRPQS